MAPKGRILGIDIDDAAYVPVATAMQMFNLDELMEIDLLFSHAGLVDGVVRQVTRVLTDRHAGREDFTITTQTAMLDVFENVMNVITASVGAIAGISLLVGAIGILTMMWITVNERVHEIGLMRALGATAAQVQRLFLLEAVILTLVGGVLGIAAGLGIAQVLSFAVPGMPVYTPLRYMLAALVVSALTGLLSGVAPARRAATDGLTDPAAIVRAAAIGSLSESPAEEFVNRIAPLLTDPIRTVRMEAARALAPTMARSREIDPTLVRRYGAALEEFFPQIQALGHLVGARGLDDVSAFLRDRRHW